ncbi:MAG TPA: hypothetical protein VNI84_04730 [Pyrinomonadaceae bacterium]|nr:hypothetical protein [Pyrinomonadaceae bacterium]
MKFKVFIGFFVFVFSFAAVFSQEAQTSPTPTRNRVVVSPPTPSPTPASRVVVTNKLPSPTATPTPRPNTAPIQNPAAYPSATPSIYPTPAPVSPTFFKPLGYKQIKSKIEEAKRQMTTRPIPTALTDVFLVTDVIRIAFYDYTTAKVDYLVTTKSSFLQKNSDVRIMSSNGKPVTLRTIRANGVNTPVMIIDDQNLAHLPLLVQYPIEKFGRHTDTAYYISTHPGIVTPEVVNAGKLYVRNTLDTARENLQKKGLYISPLVVDIAERLSIVEHVDHQRFRNEYSPTVFNDVFALYALNEGQTYRYSVSSAGAGGMVQMIPSTYRIVRSRYYSAGLIPDFVEGMRNHANAAQAMLLYMQMTWNDLNSNTTIAEALESGIATPPELMSAGYNSNPAKLPGYIRRGGENWKALIPRETKIYLQINAAMDRHVPVIPRTK